MFVSDVSLEQYFVFLARERVNESIKNKLMG